ncbi:MAG: ABC transporter permease subunit [Treponema sp.]|jgi:putative aldouronate transport system permease protein|nr:ABC transporter permease subunit [Treponema sp.]
MQEIKRTGLGKRSSHIAGITTNLVKFRWQYAMLLPGVVCLFLFSYMPMVGVQIAFRNYRIGNTIWNARWVGLTNFRFFLDPEFWRVLKNTLVISVSRFVFGFPAPIILALLINEIRSLTFKRLVQSVTYLPHFISWVVVAYLIDAFLAPNTGLLNQFFMRFGGESIFFMGRVDLFVPIIVISNVWKTIGWGTIVYLAAITGIDPEMYEAATIDGANRFAQVWHITIPCIIPTVVLMLILAMPSLLNAGMDQIYPLQNNVNLPVSNVLDIYILNNGLRQGRYSMSTAVGLVNSLVALFLIVVSNKAANKLSGDGLW